LVAGRSVQEAMRSSTAVTAVTQQGRLVMSVVSQCRQMCMGTRQLGMIRLVMVGSPRFYSRVTRPPHAASLLSVIGMQTRQSGQTFFVSICAHHTHTTSSFSGGCQLIALAWKASRLGWCAKLVASNLQPIPWHVQSWQFYTTCCVTHALLLNPEGAYMQQ
jgi:hypothetical protein